MNARLARFGRLRCPASVPNAWAPWISGLGGHERGVRAGAPVVGSARALRAAHEVLANLPPPRPMQRPATLLARLRRSPFHVFGVEPAPTPAALSADIACRHPPAVVDATVPGLDMPNRLIGSELAFAEPADFASRVASDRSSTGSIWRVGCVRS